MKKFIALSTTLLSLAVPIGTALASYDPPCERSDFYVGGQCLTRTEFNVNRAPAMMRRYERYSKLQMEQNMNQAQGLETQRTISQRASGVRAAANGFDLRLPQSRRYNPAPKTVSLNLQRLRVRLQELGPAATRLNFTAAARASQRTKRMMFYTNANSNDHQ